MQTQKASPKQDVRPTAPLPVQPLTEKEMSSVSGGTMYGYFMA
jgi:bacteriocin-like protein